MQRRGFTLIEMVISMTILVIVAAELAMMFVGLFRMQKDRMWNAEFSTALRAQREHILFSAVPAAESKVYGGVLSATNLIWQSGSRRLVANYQRSGRNQTVEYDSNFPELYRQQIIRRLDNGEKVITDLYITNNLVFASIEATVGDSNRVERIAVPLFGRSGENLWADFMSPIRDNCGNNWQ